MSEYDITVALIADPDDPYRQMASQEEWERPYGDRPKVRLRASSLSSLAEVLHQAAADLGAAPPPGYEFPTSFPASRRIAFYKPEDEEKLAPRSMPRLHWAELVLVDETGRAVFGVHDQRAITIEDLVRAGEAGVVDGDPLRPYLIIEPGWGDAPPPDWPTFITGLEVAWDVLNVGAVVGGAWAFADQIRRRLQSRVGAGKKAAKDRREWAQRGTRPYQFAALARTRQWKTEELADLLGCSEKEAEAILWILGFSYDEDNRVWSWGEDIESDLLQAINEQIAISAHRGSRGWEEDLRRRITQLLATGERPPIDP